MSEYVWHDSPSYQLVLMDEELGEAIAWIVKSTSPDGSIRLAWWLSIDLEPVKEVRFSPTVEAAQQAVSKALAKPV